MRSNNMLKKYLVFGLLATTFVAPSAAFAKQTQVNSLINIDQVISDSGVAKAIASAMNNNQQRGAFTDNLALNTNNQFTRIDNNSIISSWGRNDVAITGKNTTPVLNIGTASHLNTNTINQNVLPYPTSSFSSSSSFDSHSSFANQCGLSISGGYINNYNQDAFQVMFTFNTNPCTNQNNLEKLRQENESKRELTRSNSQIIITCINARLQSVQKDNNPDVICKLTDFPIPK